MGRIGTLARIAAVALPGLLAATVAAAAPGDPIGTWWGVLHGDPNEVGRVELRVSTADIGRVGGYLDYEGARNCAIEARYAGEAEGLRWFDLIDSNCPHVPVLNLDLFRLGYRVNEDGSASYYLIGGKALVESATLAARDSSGGLSELLRTIGRPFADVFDDAPPPPATPPTSGPPVARPAGGPVRP